MFFTDGEVILEKQLANHPKPTLEPPMPSGLTSNIDEPSPRLDYTLNSLKCFDDGYLSVNKLTIKTNTFAEDVYNVYKK